jgi:hypothetical protein
VLATAADLSVKSSFERDAYYTRPLLRCQSAMRRSISIFAPQADSEEATEDPMEGRTLSQVHDCSGRRGSPKICKVESMESTLNSNAAEYGVQARYRQPLQGTSGIFRLSQLWSTKFGSIKFNLAQLSPTTSKEAESSRSKRSRVEISRDESKLLNPAFLCREHSEGVVYTVPRYQWQYQYRINDPVSTCRLSSESLSLFEI